MNNMKEMVNRGSHDHEEDELKAKTNRNDARDVAEKTIIKVMTAGKGLTG